MSNIGIIGTGNIGGAIARGLTGVGGVRPDQVYLSRKRMDLLEAFRTEGYHIADNQTLAESCEVVIVAVLPGQARGVVEGIAPQLNGGGRVLVSSVAAVTVAEYREWLGSSIPVVRIMPNTATEFGAGMTCLAGEDEEALKRVEELMAPLGETLRIKEPLMPAATILAACGIAFFLRYIRAVSQGGIQIGFHAEEAGRIAAQTARGAAELLLKTGHHPEMEIDRVTTPMGCTISGLNEMEHFGLSSAMIKGIVKSYEGISDLK